MHSSLRARPAALHRPIPSAWACLQVVVAMIGPYKRLRLSYLATQLNVSQAEAQQLLVGLILDERIKGRIDQVLPWSGWGQWPLVAHGVAHGLRKCSVGATHPCACLATPYDVLHGASGTHDVPSRGYHNCLP